MYGDFVRTVSEEFDHRLSQIKAEHNYELGPEFEIAICNALRRVLPHRFGICRGYAVNSTGTKAGDDIIVYDRYRFPTTRLLNEDFSRKEEVPIEAIYAYIEAKHTFCLEGDGEGTLIRAMKQAASVKCLCEARSCVPLTQITPNVNIDGEILFEQSAGWPSTRNPCYTILVSRQVRLKADAQPTFDAAEIYNRMVGQVLEGIRVPDLIIAGRSNLVIPVMRSDVGDILTSPFAISGAFNCQIVNGYAFGVGVCHLLWALEYINLGAMRWDLILANALGIPPRPTGQ